GHALTLTAGALRVAPFATDLERLTILVDDPRKLDYVASSADIQAVEEGENVTFLATGERWPLLFRRRVDEIWVASDVQLYLDLWASSGRGMEQARHLRTERLGF